jgi:hypothetical protein
MQIRAVNGKLSLGSLFMPLVIGYSIGWGLMFALILPLPLVSILSSRAVDGNGHVVTGIGAKLAMVAPVLLLFPLIIVMQSVMMAGSILLGLVIYRTMRPIRVVTEA